MSNGKPIKEILPEVIRKLIIQRKHYLKQQRINRRKKNRDPNQPPLPGMKQGGNVATDYSKKVSQETYQEAEKDLGKTKGKVHHLKDPGKAGKKRLKELRKKQNWIFTPEKILKEVYPQRDKGWGGKHSRKVEHNANGGVMTKGRGPHGKTDEELLKEAYPGQFRNESNALAPGFHTKGRARGGFVKKAGGTKRVPGSGAATKGTNFEGIF